MRTRLSSLRGAKRRSNPFFRYAAMWIASLAFAMTRDRLFEIRIGQLASRDARGGTVGEAAMAGTIGQAFDRRVAAEAEILSPRRADRPAASRLAQFKQRAAVFVVDRFVVKARLRLGVGILQHLILQPRRRFQANSLGEAPGQSSGGALARRAPFIGAVFAGQIEARELANDGVAADADVGGDLAAGEPGLKPVFQEFDAFGSPGGLEGGHVDGPKLRMISGSLTSLS